MRFETLTVRGFLSFSDKPQEIRLSKRGLVLVEGENRDDPTVDNNGSGKSSISEALLWGLFGKTLRGLTADKVVNRKSKIGCHVAVEFTNDAGEGFRVDRYRKDDEHRNKLLFASTKRVLTANDSDETQRLIVDALGMDFDTFTSAVVFGQGQIKHFASMTDKEMKSVIDKLLGLEQLVDAHKRAKADLLVTMQDVLDEQAKLIDVTALEQELADAKSERDAWAQKQVQRIAQATSAVAYDASEHATAKAQRKEAKELCEVAREHYAQAKAEAARVSGLHEAETTALRRIRPVEVLKACPTCKRPFDTSAAEKQAAQAKADLDEAQARVDKVWKKVVATSRALTDATMQRNLGEQALAEAEKAEADLRTQKDRFDAQEATVRALKAEENPHEKRVQKYATRIKEAREGNEQQERAIALLQEKRQQLEFIVNMLSDKGVPGQPPLKALIVESVAPFLNQRLLHYAGRLTRNMFEITFEATRALKSGETKDLYELRVVNRSGGDSYDASSGGERRKIDAAIFFAFQALAASRAREQVRFAIWDEVFDALDETAQEVMMELLLEEQKSRDTMLVVTQRPELRGHFPTSIKVVKEKGFSRLA